MSWILQRTNRPRRLRQQLLRGHSSDNNDNEGDAKGIADDNDDELSRKLKRYFPCPAAGQHI